MGCGASTEQAADPCAAGKPTAHLMESNLRSVTPPEAPAPGPPALYVRPSSAIEPFTAKPSAEAGHGDGEATEPPARRAGTEPPAPQPSSPALPRKLALRESYANLPDVPDDIMDLVDSTGTTPSSGTSVFLFCYADIIAAF